jgi:hypothetical protein
MAKDKLFHVYFDKNGVFVTYSISEPDYTAGEGLTMIPLDTIPHTIDQYTKVTYTGNENDPYAYGRFEEVISGE